MSSLDSYTIGNLYSLAENHVRLAISSIFESNYEEAIWWINFMVINPKNKACNMLEDLRDMLDMVGLTDYTAEITVHSLFVMKTELTK